MFAPYIQNVRDTNAARESFESDHSLILIKGNDQAQWFTITRKILQNNKKTNLMDRMNIY